VFEDPAAYQAKLEDLEEGTDVYIALVRKKYKYRFVKYMHVRMPAMVKTYAGEVGYVKLSSAYGEALQRLSKELIPLPRKISGSIRTYQRNAPYHPTFLRKSTMSSTNLAIDQMAILSALANDNCVSQHC
jgi:hypothetical protein|tara:strand:- start:3770 stop:4159 length:390 start_codon:yes stop_codon:yes gene_type:complete